MDFTELYSEKDRRILKDAEDSLVTRTDRVQEIIAYARRAGINRLGIANCVAFSKEADVLEEILTEEGFQVSKVNCKHGRVPFNKLVPGYDGVSCNPAGQAKFLEDADTELNIMMGLCLGHDIIFNSKSKATVTPLIVKDRKIKPSHALSPNNQ